MTLEEIHQIRQKYRPQFKAISTLPAAVEAIGFGSCAGIYLHLMRLDGMPVLELEKAAEGYAGSFALLSTRLCPYPQEAQQCVALLCSLTQEISGISCNPPKDPK